MGFVQFTSLTTIDQNKKLTKMKHINQFMAYTTYLRKIIIIN